MNVWTAYNAATGEAETVFYGQQPTRKELAGRPYIQGCVDRATQFVSAQGIVARPTITAVLSSETIQADGISEVHLIDLPIPCKITIGKEAYEVHDGRFDVSFTAPGRYRIRVEAFPYIPAEFEVTAT